MVSVPIFTPPSVADLPGVLPETRGLQMRLFRYYGQGRRGLSVLRTGGVYSTVDNPTQDQLDATGNREGTDFYLGGHIYFISDVAAAALVAAGYSANVTYGTWAELAAYSWGAAAAYLWGGTP